MLKFFNLKPEIFGVDVNDESLRIVKLKKKRKGFSVVSCCEVDIAPGIIKEGVIVNQEALAKRIKIACQGVKGKKLGTKYAIISLPEEKSFSQVIQMPIMTQEELRSAVPLEAENYIPLPLDKVYLDFETIYGHRGQLAPSHTDLLINVMPKSIVDSYVACFKKAGLIPCIMEVESQSIVRALLPPKTTTPPQIIIDLGNANTNFIIFSGNSIRFTSSIPFSSAELTRAIAIKLKVTLAKAEELKIKHGIVSRKSEKKYDIFSLVEPMLQDLAAQIKKYITFYQDHVSHEYFPSDGKIEKIVLCGGGANLKGLYDFFFDVLKIPVEMGNPMVNMLEQKKGKGKLISDQEVLAFTTVLGLALRGAES